MVWVGGGRWAMGDIQSAPRFAPVPVGVVGFSIAESSDSIAGGSEEGRGGCAPKWISKGGPNGLGTGLGLIDDDDGSGWRPAAPDAVEKLVGLLDLGGGAFLSAISNAVGAQRVRAQPKGEMVVVRSQEEA